VGIFGFLGGLVKPLVGLVDELNTSDEERLQLHLAITQIESDLKEAGYKYDTALAEARSSIIVAEAKSQSWLARNWRPLVMLTFAVEIVLISTGSMDVDSLVLVPEQMWRLLQIGIGGYIVGRSAEKIVPQVFNNKKKEKGD